MDIDKNVYRVFNEEDLKDHDAIAAVIRNKEGQYLMLHHKKYNFWTFPIGKVKPNQSIQDALREEVREECGIDVITFRKIWHFSKKYERKNYLININTHIFEINSYKGKVNNEEPDKHSDLKWFSIDEIKTLESISDSTREYLNILEQRKNHQIIKMVYAAYRGNIYYDELFSDILGNFKEMTPQEIDAELMLQGSFQDDSDVIVLEYRYDTDTIERHFMNRFVCIDSIAHRNGGYRLTRYTRERLGDFYDSGDVRWDQKNKNRGK